MNGTSSRAIHRIEDLQCWQSARQLVIQVYGLCKATSLNGDHAMANQIKRASISVMNNIAEGFARSNRPKEFARFLEIAQGSAVEVVSMTYLIADLGYASGDRVVELRELAEKTKALTLGLLSHVLRKSRMRQAQEQ